MNWDSALKKIIPQPCYERPFVCDGFPSESVMIVIGENPATSMQNDWWSYWSPTSGFNLDGFVDDYLDQRRVIGKGISNTRRRLNRLQIQNLILT